MFRKLIVTVGIGSVLLLAGLPSVVAWLYRIGVIEGAARLRTEYLTGTATTIIIALLILLPSTYRIQLRTQECLVCGEHVRPGGKYCPACGSRVAA